MDKTPKANNYWAHLRGMSRVQRWNLLHKTVAVVVSTSSITLQTDLESCKQKHQHPSTIQAHRPLGVLSLPVLLLDTRLGNLKAAVHCTQPRKCGLGQIRPVVVVTDLLNQEQDHYDYKINSANLAKQGFTHSDFFNSKGLSGKNKKHVKTKPRICKVA
jgi:hypothetical protein